jgi:DNA helicase HerA-like ATPase
MSDAGPRIDPRAPSASARFLAARPHAPAPPPAKPAAPLRVVAALREDDIDLGASETGGSVGLSLGALLDGRLLIQGLSGAGKSWTLRRLLEQTEGRVQQLVIDPEGEFAGLSAELGMIELDASALDIASVAAAAARLREHRLSARLDLSQLERERQLVMFAAFARALIDAPAEHWSPALVVVDEAHLFAPFGGAIEGAGSVRREAIGALVDVMSRGRKRGLAGVLATQRLARMAKSVASEALNFLVGRNTLDLDIRRAAETVGWDARKASDRLPMLSPGEFVAVGPGFSRSPAVLKVGAARTRHAGARPGLAPPPKLDAAGALLIDVDGLVAETRDAAERRGDLTALPAGARAVREFIRDPSALLALRIFEALKPLAPDGASLRELPGALDAAEKQIAFALALLDGFAAVEFSGDGAERAVRLGKGMKLWAR